MELGRSSLALALLGSISLTACNKGDLMKAPHGMTDTFTVPTAPPKSDILFIINNTDDTMTVKATNMGNSAGPFINYLVSHSVDFQIGVTSMDMLTAPGSIGSQGYLGGNPKVINGSTPNLLSTFQANLQVGFSGYPLEQGLDAAVAAITPPLSTGGNAGFSRADARLFVVFVSDEDDTGSQTAQAYVSAITAAKGNDPNNVLLSAIAGPVPSGCNGGSGSGGTSSGADPGILYSGVITASNGLFESICDTDYSTFLNNLGYQAGSTKATFQLSEVPSDPSTIQVSVNGVTVPSSNWTYSQVTNSITFSPGSIPPAGATVVITYQVG